MILDGYGFGLSLFLAGMFWLAVMLFFESSVLFFNGLAVLLK